MSGMNNMEEIFRKAVKCACEQEYEQLDKKVDNNSHVFSQEFQEKMQNVLALKGKKHNAKDMPKVINTTPERHYRVKWKYVLLVAILMILSATTVLASDVIKEIFGKLLIQFSWDSVQIQQVNEQMLEQEIEFDRCELGYVPTGFVQTYEEVDEELAYYSAVYDNSMGESIWYEQASIFTTKNHITFDGQTKENIEIHGLTAYYISDGEINTIFFEKNNCMYSVGSQLSKEELIKIVEKIEFKR
jgi:hypothetical protein